MIYIGNKIFSNDEIKSLTKNQLIELKEDVVNSTPRLSGGSYITVFRNVVLFLSFCCILFLAKEYGIIGAIFYAVFIFACFTLYNDYTKIIESKDLIGYLNVRIAEKHDSKCDDDITYKDNLI